MSTMDEECLEVQRTQDRMARAPLDCLPDLGCCDSGPRADPTIPACDAVVLRGSSQGPVGLRPGSTGLTRILAPQVEMEAVGHFLRCDCSMGTR